MSKPQRITTDDPLVFPNNRASLPTEMMSYPVGPYRHPDDVSLNGSSEDEDVEDVSNEDAVAPKCEQMCRACLAQGREALAEGRERVQQLLVRARPRCLLKVRGHERFHGGEDLGCNRNF